MIEYSIADVVESGSIEVPLVKYHGVGGGGGSSQGHSNAFVRWSHGARAKEIRKTAALIWFNLEFLAIDSTGKKTREGKLEKEILVTKGKVTNSSYEPGVRVRVQIQQCQSKQ